MNFFRKKGKIGKGRAGMTEIVVFSDTHGGMTW